MDGSPTFALMLDKAIQAEPAAFADFDRTKNVQDQLQEMVSGVGKRYRDWGNCLSFFFDWVDWEDTVFASKYGSMEQLWLAFVMWQKYGKTWTGEEWVTG